MNWCKKMKIKTFVKNIEARVLPLFVMVLLIVAGFTAVFIINPAIKNVSAAVVGDFTYNKKITIDSTQVIGDHSNFPVFINISADADLASHVTNDSAYDIAFFDSTNTTQYAHEIVNFTQASGQLMCYVNVTNISGTGADTYFYMYYGDADGGNQENPSGTWSSDYLAVYHMNSTYDSTGTYDLTEVNGPALVEGKVGNCYDFEAGDNDGLTHASLLDTVANDAITFECFIKPESMITRGGIIGKINTVSENFSLLNLHENDYLRIEIEGQKQGEQTTFSSAISAGSWYYVASAYKVATEALIFCDNATNVTGSNIQEIGDGNGRDFYIGINNVPNTFPFDGLIDEVRVSKVKRSQAYLSTVYNNFLYNGFLTIGSENAGESEGASVYTLNGLTNSRITWNGTEDTTVWCNSTGDGHEWLEINMTINASDNVTDVCVFFDDLNNSVPDEYINASNITLYVSSDNSSYGSLGAFTDGGSNITINESQWNDGTMGTNPFTGTGLTNKNDSIWCVFKLTIPDGTSTDTFYTSSIASCAVYWKITRS